jgi:L-iditol 2-dehydrogenase
VTIRAARLVGPGEFDLVDVELPDPGAGDVVVRLLASSICGSDLHVVLGDFLPENLPAAPGYPGHEGVGVVEASGSAGFAVGDLVLSVPHLDRSTCFAQAHLARASNLIRLPEAAEPHRVLMAQQLGTVVYALKSFVPAAVEGGTAVVVGAGSAGLFFAQLLRPLGFDQVIVSEPVAARRAAIGPFADVVLDPGRDRVADAVLDLTGGAGADLAVDAAGTPAARADAVASVRPRGVVGLFGYPDRPGAELFPLHVAWRKMLTLVASANTQHEPGLLSFRTAIDLILSGAVVVDPLLSGRPRPLDEIGQAFRDAHDGVPEKLILGPHPGPIASGPPARS